jgi:probable addiction module antidote protein
MKASKDYKSYLRERLKDPNEAAAYLNAALEEDDIAVFTVALKDVIDSLGGGVGRVAKKSHLNRESLYKTLSAKGNPRLKNLSSIIKTLGLDIHIVPHHESTFSTHSSFHPTPK